MARVRTRKWNIAKAASYGAAIAASPTVMVLFVPVLFQWGEVFSPVYNGAAHPEEASSILDSVSSDLHSLAMAIIAGIAAIMGSANASWRTRPVVWIAVAATLLAIASIYSGVRFRFAIVEQLMVSQIDVDRAGDRLVAQGVTLLWSAGLLLTLSVHRFFPRVLGALVR